MAERIERVFDTKAALYLSYTVLKGNSGISRNKNTSLRNYVQTSELRTLGNCSSTVASVVRQRVARVCLRQLRVLVSFCWFSDRPLSRAADGKQFQVKFIVKTRRCKVNRTSKLNWLFGDPAEYQLRFYTLRNFMDAKTCETFHEVSVEFHVKWNSMEYFKWFSIESPSSFHMYSHVTWKFHGVSHIPWSLRGKFHMFCPMKFHWV